LKDGVLPPRGATLVAQKHERLSLTKNKNVLGHQFFFLVGAM
jgi:hypothetical protein